MANERLTEDMVDETLRALHYLDDPDAVVVEKQQSAIKAIRSGLAKASKTGKGGVGYPEFVITTPDAPDMVVVIECKADVKRHESPNLDRPIDFALDGALHYARSLSASYTAIAIAVSGDRRSNRWSFHLIPKGENESRDLLAPTGAPIQQMVGMDDLVRAASFDPKVQAQRTRDLIAFSMEMHEFMRDEAELEEKEKPLVVAGTLIALSNQVFAKSFDNYPAVDLPSFWMQTIKTEIAKAKLPVSKLENITQPFTGVEVHPELRKPTKGYPKGLMNEIVGLLAERVMPFLTIYHDYDVVGQFYGEFLRTCSES